MSRLYRVGQGRGSFTHTTPLRHHRTIIIILLSLGRRASVRTCPAFDLRSNNSQTIPPKQSSPAACRRSKTRLVASGGRHDRGCWASVVLWEIMQKAGGLSTQKKQHLSSSVTKRRPHTKTQAGQCRLINAADTPLPPIKHTGISSKRPTLLPPARLGSSQSSTRAGLPGLACQHIQ